MYEKKKTNDKLTIYIGPSIKNVVDHNRVFCGELPDQLMELLEQDAVLSQFVIDLNKMVSAIKQIKQEGSTLNVLYKKVEKEYRRI